MDLLTLRIIQAIAFTSLIVIRGIRKRSLSLSGGITATLVGMIICLNGFKFTAVLGTFFFSSSFFTKYKQDIKKHLEEDFKEGGQRNWVQVIANSLWSTIASFLILYTVGITDTYFDFQAHRWSSLLLAAYIGQFACCNGDTWASELGVLSKSKPILVTTLKQVPTGTNGGITTQGCVVSLLGGLVIGIAYFFANLAFSDTSLQPPQYPAIILATLGGIIGSMIDSLMGATLQYSGWSEEKKKVVSAPGPRVKHITGISVLDNHMVNLLSSGATAVLIALIAEPVFAIL